MQHEKLEFQITRIFRFIGEQTAKRPWHFVIFSLVLIAVCCGGIALIDFAPPFEKTWIPQQSVAIENKKYFEEAFGDFRPAVLIVTAKDGGDVLRKEILLEMGKMHQMFMNYTVISKKGPMVGRNFTYNALCARALPVASCITSSVLAFWNFELAAIENDPNPHLTVSGNSTIASSLQLTKIDRVLGGITWNADGTVQSAGAALSAYLTKASEDMDEISKEWERGFLAIIAKDWEHIVIDRWSRRSQKDEIDRVIPHDAKLIAVSVVVMVVYVSAFLGRLHLRYSKVTLGFLGVLGVILSLASGIGLCGYFGARFSEIIVGVPFIVVGIGVDDMFIIVNAFDRASRRKLPLVERMTETMAEIGASITMTSFTSVYAFYIGANANLPSMQGFCIFAGTCLLMCYLLQILLFSPLVIIDARRHQQNRIDCVPCLKWSRPIDSSADEAVAELPAAGDGGSAGSPLEEMEERASKTDDESSWAEKYLLPKVVPLLFKRPVKIGVIVLSILLAVFGVVASSQLKTGLSQREVLPGDSYVLRYFETESHYFGGASYQISIIFQTFDYSDRQNQDAMLQLYETLKDSPLLEKEMHFWLIDFLDWLPRSSFADRLVDGRPASETEFYIALYNFLINPQYGPKHLTDIVFQSGFIKTSRFGTRHVPFPSDLQKADAMLQIQAIVAKAKVPAIAYGYHYLYWTQYVGLISSTVTNFAMVSVGIFLFLWIFLGSIPLSIIVLLNIVLVDMELLAVMYVWDIGLTQVSLVLLLLSIGLAVDSCAHVAHAWVTSKHELSQERSIDALHRMGPSVFSGALTSFLGILILGISNHRVLLALFKFFFAMFLLAMWHGLVFLPTILSLLPNRRTSSGLESVEYSGLEQKEETEESERE